MSITNRLLQYMTIKDRTDLLEVMESFCMKIAHAIGKWVGRFHQETTIHWLVKHFIAGWTESNLLSVV